MLPSKLKKVFSAFIAVFFAMNTMLPVGWSVSAERKRISHEEHLKKLPRNIAQIEALHQGFGEDGKPYFIYIQDAHSNPSAQKNIYKILHFLFDQTGNSKKLVALEGAVGILHPEFLDFFKEFPDVNKSIRLDLLAKGELTGAELFAYDLFAEGLDTQDLFHGVEEGVLYREHGNAYDQVMAQAPAIEKFMNHFQRELAKAEVKTLNPELSKFLKEAARRREGVYNEKFISAGSAKSASLPQYSTYLNMLAGYARDQLLIDLDQIIEQTRFPQIFRLKALQKIEGDLDESAASREWTVYQAQFSEELTTEILETLAIAFRKDRAQSPLSLRQALEYLAEDHPKAYDSLVRSHNMKKYITMKMAQSELDIAVLVNEMDRLEYEIAKNRTRSVKESLWLQLYKDYTRLGRLFRMELTSEDWRFMKNRSGQGSPERLVQRLKMLGYGQSFKTSLIGFQPYEAATSFYQLAELRDDALLNNTLSAAKKNGAEVVILVSGGFHDDGIRRALESKGYSYAVIRPVITETDQSHLYHQVMSRSHSNVFNRPDERLSSEQIALTLKEMLDVGMPLIAKNSSRTDTELARILHDAVKNHPLLSHELEVQMAAGSGPHENARVIFTTPGFRSSARVKQLYTGDDYHTLQPREGTLASWPVSIRAGLPVVESAGVRSEVRAASASKYHSYRKYGAPRTPEESRASLGRAIELPALVRVQEDIARHLDALGKAKGKMTAEEFAEFAGQQNRGFFTGASAPVPGRDVITASTLAGFQAEAARDPSLQEAVRGIERLTRVIPSEVENQNVEIGRALLREGKIEVITLAGGMSVRGAIFANHLVYIPGYGKVPLLAVQILNAFHLAKQEGLKKIPFSIAESDYTARYVSEVLHWLSSRGFIKVEDIERFDVSVINRIDGAGLFFAENHRDGYAVASHFDGLLYYIYSGQYARARQAGVQYAKFSNMNIPTATLDLGIIGQLHAEREAVSDKNRKPGVLIEQTLNKNEKGGFRATGQYLLPNGERREVQQMIESFIVEGTPDFNKLVQHKEEYPVFNANSIVVSLDWIEDFFGLNQLTAPPTFDNLQDPQYRDQVVTQIGKKISRLGDEDPGHKIQLYYELKKVKNPETGHAELILQISRLLGQTATIDPNSIFYTVPRQTATASRYDEAKKQRNISANADAWVRYLRPQLPGLRRNDTPVKAADILMAEMNAFYLDADAMNEEAQRGEDDAFKVQTSGFESQAFEFYNFILRELDVRDAIQIAEYQGYLGQILAAADISHKMDLMQTFMGRRRSEVRFNVKVESTAELAAQLGDSVGAREINPFAIRVAIDFGGVFEVTEPGRSALLSHLRLPSLQELTAPEHAALGEEFTRTFFPRESGLYRQADQYVLRENINQFPALDSEMKLWARYLASHPDFTWVLDVDGASKEETDRFLKGLTELAKAWGTPINEYQIRISASVRDGFDFALLDRPSREQVFGYLSTEELNLQSTRADAKASFRRIHQARVLDRMLAAEALRQQIPDELQRGIGPLQELAAAVFKTSYASLEAGFLAYQRLAASA